MTDPVPQFEITKSAQFDAAHRLPAGPRGEYQRLHGHSFMVEASVRGPMSEPVGWVSDLGALDRGARPPSPRRSITGCSMSIRDLRARRWSGSVCTSPTGFAPNFRD